MIRTSKEHREFMLQYLKIGIGGGSVAGRATFYTGFDRQAFEWGGEITSHLTRWGVRFHK